MTDGPNLSLGSSSKGKEKSLQSGPVGVKSGTEQLVLLKPSNLLRPPGLGLLAGEAHSRLLFTPLTDAQKVTALEGTILWEWEEHWQALEAASCPPSVPISAPGPVDEVVMPQCGSEQVNQTKLNPQ
jgi:hypothetical protein